MKQVMKRVIGALLTMATLATTIAIQPTKAEAASKKVDAFDFDNASKGYVTVDYEHTNDSKRLKVGITKSGETHYYDITSGEETNLPLTDGSGKYTATLFVQKSGNTYTVKQKETETVKIKSSTQVYLNNISEVSWEEGGSVQKKAKQLIKGKKTTRGRAMAIYSYIVTTFKYDNSLASKVKSGKLTTYIPDTAKVLKNKKGICYDIASLYAAMCRSVGIPCKVVKGTAKTVGGVYHAWNSVYDKSTKKWITMDLTVDMCKGKSETKYWRPVKDSQYKAQEVI
ncbi:MAG: transglutaminase domain-containing protein [Christensenellaceae bacterium]|nr:transglutaminase domain-containing protein [Christensenellaceae bacterium]